MTLMFSVVQAMVAGEANVTLISPFAGRITDWFKQRDKVAGYAAPEDPGVISVKQIYNYLKAYGYKTVVMGASFRNKEQVMELAVREPLPLLVVVVPLEFHHLTNQSMQQGCDLLTVSPQLLQELDESEAEVPQRLNAATAQTSLPKTILNESEFRLRMNADEMADFKLSEGIRKYVRTYLPTYRNLPCSTLMRELTDSCWWVCVQVHDRSREARVAAPCSPRGLSRERQREMLHSFVVNLPKPQTISILLRMSHMAATLRQKGSATFGSVQWLSCIDTFTGG